MLIGLLISFVSLVTASPKTKITCGISYPTKYKVQKIDRCSRIAASYNILPSQLSAKSFDAICSKLKIGETLCLPPPINCESGLIAHAVTSLDNFWSLKGSVSLANFKLNNPTLNTYNIQIGNIACVEPVPVSPKYVIRSQNTTCTLIANMYNTQVSIIQFLNPRVDCQNLEIKQKIRVPRPIVCLPDQITEIIGSTVSVTTTCKRLLALRGHSWSLGNFYINNPSINCNSLRIGNIVCLPPSPVEILPSIEPSYLIKI